MKGNLIPREEHEQALHELVQIFLRGLDYFKQQVAARIRKPAVMKIAERIIALTRDEIAERIERGG